MRFAIMDLGTNTFHLLISEINSKGESRTIFKSKRTVKLGEGAIHRQYIDAVPFERGLKAIIGFAGILKKYKVDRVAGFATSAIRGASNGKLFIREIYRHTDLRMEVISGLREAGLIYNGVRQCVPIGRQPVLIMDIGGGSTEFIIANGNRIFWKHSFDIGAARLLELFPPSNPIAEPEIRKINRFLDRELKPLQVAMEKFSVNQLIGASGSFETLAEMMGWRFHKRNNAKSVKSLSLDLKEYEAIHQQLLLSTTAQRMKMKGLVKMRVDMIVPASICTKYVLKKFKLKEMVLSKYALKEGALWELSRNV
jgi:exopolyphosphatase / guanosine-5'-triphosphate,3'-diphosphate pyrophosphatase